MSKELIEVNGLIAKFPKNVKAHDAYAFLEKVKIPKNKIWYIIVQKQDDELQMVKYNQVAGINLTSFVSELKNYYTNKYSNNNFIIEKINSLEVIGEDKFTIIKNISKDVIIDNKPLISIIMDDLTKLLSI